MKPTRIAVIGGGWRSEFYLRVAKAAPEMFTIVKTLIRTDEKAKVYEEKWGIKTVRTFEELTKEIDFDFVILSVPRKVSPEYMIKLSKLNIPVLCETPPAATTEDMVELFKEVGKDNKIQVTEQYHVQPMHNAMINVLNTGLIGTRTHAQVSIAHGYHGMSLIRKFLGINFENATIKARKNVTEIVKGPHRDGLPKERVMQESVQQFAFMDFGDKTAVFDFVPDQYFSFIRGQRLVIRGEKGEVINQECTYLKDIVTPIKHEFVRMDTGLNGNLEGYYHKGIIFGDDWAYKTPFPEKRLSDDEIAAGACMLGMAEFVQTGKEFYSLAQAMQDTYLSFVVDESIATGKEITTQTQIWAE